MNKSLLKNIHNHVKKLKEQAVTPDPAATPSPTPAPAAAAPATPAPATPPTPASPAPVADPNAPVAAPAPGTDPMAATGPAAPAGGEDATPAPASDASGGEEDGGGDEAPEGQPPINRQDPITAVFDYGKEIAKKTIEPETILKAIKTSIQSNFGGNFEAAWPIVQRLKDTENTILIDVANRLSLFISGTIQENKNKGMKPMKISKQEVRNMVREAVREQTKPKNINLSQKQFEKIIHNTVLRTLNEGALFDTYRSEIDREQSAIEQQLTSADIRRMAIDLFEKICDKTGVDADSLTPEAMQFVKAELDRMVTSAQEIANKLIQVATVVKTASGSSAKKEEG